MIEKALQLTRDVLNQYLQNSFQLNESQVVLNNIIDATGNIPLLNQNKVVISLINVEKESLRPFYADSKKTGNGNYADFNPSERYNLHLLISPQFDNYNETLKFLNAVILFFQANQVLDSTFTTAMPTGIPRLEMDIEKISYLQMHNLWTAMGAKYQPSVLYRMRLLTLQAGEVRSFTRSINTTSSKALA